MTCVDTVQQKNRAECAIQGGRQLPQQLRDADDLFASRQRHQQMRSPGSSSPGKWFSYICVSPSFHHQRAMGAHASHDACGSGH